MLLNIFDLLSVRLFHILEENHDRQAVRINLCAFMVVQNYIPLKSKHCK